MQENVQLPIYRSQARVISLGMSAMAPNILCKCADRRFIDVCSYKGSAAGKGQYSLSQMDDCWIRKEWGEALGRGTGSSLGFTVCM